MYFNTKTSSGGRRALKYRWALSSSIVNVFQLHESMQSESRRCCSYFSPRAGIISYGRIMSQRNVRFTL
jgi:hypothetical protein